MTALPVIRAGAIMDTARFTGYHTEWNLQAFMKHINNIKIQVSLMKLK